MAGRLPIGSPQKRGCPILATFPLHGLGSANLNQPFPGTSSRLPGRPLTQRRTAQARIAKGGGATRGPAPWLKAESEQRSLISVIALSRSKPAFWGAKARPKHMFWCCFRTKTALFRVILHFLSHVCLNTFAHAATSFCHRCVRNSPHSRPSSSKPPAPSLKLRTET